ncbi:hypothetical protein [Rhizobium metallidurans]|uniref:Uncharacterized protein n=1 Tax=Rhizobium metallidurans TaxID=1265931 RepID=A0A7W6GCU0_9HYPH|nr:hypothetical protein [Rhizobium metallidurans]MBB3967163.1 hypothetical protein [Rhizobium metallidurans]
MSRTPSQILGNASLRPTPEERREIEKRAKAVLEEILAVPPKRKPPQADPLVAPPKDVFQWLLDNEKKAAE